MNESRIYRLPELKCIHGTKYVRVEKWKSENVKTKTQVRIKFSLLH